MDAGKNITATVAFDAWGYQLGSTFNTPGPLAPYQWNAGSGYRSDGDEPSGFLALQKVGARYYDPEFGCFLTRDSDLNEKPFAYCDGDPVNFIDPDGHQKQHPGKKKPGASNGPTPSSSAASGSGNGIVNGTTDEEKAAAALAAGIVNVVVDAETKNKYLGKVAGVATGYILLKCFEDGVFQQLPKNPVNAMPVGPDGTFWW